ncbi:hypothetical protein SAMN05421743_11278 [Thalassobacillus cyri]|uniref:Transporter suffix domain-containing protein n=1 Tax=Thalassobacillus cyri TaxID=571932 RepID=A0A1H4FQV5_9BACI|nr:transporter suffix domain-containing protein [Thalassobacillus cyri]SEA99739.1 hypothetical protein SAMN05421743_11278 [Thalassobacillus cyri]
MQKNSTLQKPWIYKVGMILIISSILIWVISPVLIPFLPLTNGVKAISITTSLIIGEVIFWIGALMAGKKVANNIKKSFNPKNWRKKFVHKEQDRE